MEGEFLSCPDCGNYQLALRMQDAIYFCPGCSREFDEDDLKAEIVDHLVRLKRLRAAIKIMNQVGQMVDEVGPPEVEEESEK